MWLVWTPRALRDLQRIATYLGARSPAGAKRVLAEIRSTIETRPTAPRIGQLIDDAQHRRLVVLRYPYVIFYRLDGDAILVLHIRHAARRPLASGR